MYFQPLFAALIVTFTAASSVQAISGNAKHFKPNGTVEACGKPVPNSQHAVRLSTERFGSGGNCARKIQVNHNGKTVQATVEGRCKTCATDDINLSQSAFKELAPLKQAPINVTWNFE